ncbi:scyllo-inositol 2-dehydrogenase (NAD(+)) [subsurface metagenome]
MIGIGIIGVGYWGKNHVSIYKSLLQENRINYIKLCDTYEERVKEISEINSLEYTTKIEDILNDDKITAVVIITPSSTHYELAKLSLESGKDVFVEKPITLKSDNAMKLIDLAKQKRKILMVGHLFRYHPAVEEIKKRIDIGEFGKIQMIMTFRFALGVPKKDMGVILALAVHDLDLTCYLLNKKEPKSILVDSGKFNQEVVAEMTNISLNFDNNTKSYIMESWNIPVYGKRRELLIIGSEKSALINYLTPSEYQIFDSSIKHRKINDKIIFEKHNNGIQKIVIEYKEPLKQEILHFIKCIETRTTPNSDGLVGYHAVRMCEKAKLSAEKNERIYF